MISYKEASQEKPTSEVKCSVISPISAVPGVTNLLARRSHGAELEKEIIAGPILTPF